MDEINNSARTFFLSHGVQLRMSYSYTSPQNGKVERMIRTINDVMCSQLFHAVSLIAGLHSPLLQVPWRRRPRPRHA
jgi:hypothetical protein